MYHQKVVQQRLSKYVDALRKLRGDDFELPDREVWEIEERSRALDRIWDAEKGVPTRALTFEEELFVVQECLRSKADFNYWATRYPKIKTKDATLERVKYFESQEIIYKRLAQIELQNFEHKRLDGVMAIILKARQLGASTLSEMLLAHKSFFYGNITAVIAADVPEQSAYLFDMVERIYEHLPWWMRPEITYHEKDDHYYFGKIDTLIGMASGKSVRGGDSEERGRGQIARGKTIHAAHLSELSTWDNPFQIDSSLLPAIPRRPSSLAILESTARGRGNWWHDTWIAAKKGLGRFVPVFIPWYAETHTYTAPAPADWQPSEITLAHATQVERKSPQWMGKSVRLTRDQLYWWELTRAEAVQKRALHDFLAEYCADDEEAFQNTHRSIFPVEIIDQIHHKLRPIAAVAEVKYRYEQTATA